MICVKTRFGYASIPFSFDDNNVVFVWEQFWYSNGLLLCSFDIQFWFWIYNVQRHRFWRFVLKFAYVLNHSWEVLKDIMLLLQCSFRFCADSLMRSSERRYVVAVIFFMLMNLFTPEKFWKDVMLLLNDLSASASRCDSDYQAFEERQASEVLLLCWRLWRSQARRWRCQGSDWRLWSFVT